MITEKNHKLLTSQLFVTDCTKKGLASMFYGAECHFQQYFSYIVGVGNVRRNHRPVASH